jgi:hypothetical protein
LSKTILLLERVSFRRLSKFGVQIGQFISKFIVVS